MDTLVPTDYTVESSKDVTTTSLTECTSPEQPYIKLDGTIKCGTSTSTTVKISFGIILALLINMF